MDRQHQRANRSGTLTGADFALTGITPDVDTYHHGGHGHRGWIGSNDSQFTVTVSGGGLASADQAGIGLALSSSSSFADIAGNLADSTADDASAYNETYTLDNTPLGAPSASLTTDTGATAGHTSDEAVTVTAAAESYGVRYSLDGSSFVSDPGSLPFSGDGSYRIRPAGRHSRQLVRLGTGQFHARHHQPQWGDGVP